MNKPGNQKNGAFSYIRQHSWRAISFLREHRSLFGKSKAILKNERSLLLEVRLALNRVLDALLIVPPLWRSFRSKTHGSTKHQEPSRLALQKAPG